MKKLLFILLCFLVYNELKAQDETRLMRFPTIYGNQIVFSYAGNLYSVAVNGGIARKLTSDVGYEMFPKFSPDGSTIAFTGQYDGNTEIFTIPANGGQPRRLTYTATLGRDDISDRMGPNNIVMAWTPDGKSVVYRSRKQTFNDFKGQLFNVSVNGGTSKELPLATGGFCSYSPDGKKLAFNKVFREFRTWKYYKGGMADDIWVYDLKSHKIENVTNDPHQDIEPMWIGSEIFFLSDRDRTMNLFVYNTESKKVEKVTNFTDYDIKFPSVNGDKIVFEKGGYIFVFDAKTRQSQKVSIVVADDFLSARCEWKDASRSIKSFDVSPNGERVLFSARGDIFTVPYKSGITRNLTKTSDAHERAASWSPDGKFVAYLSDKSGEYEVYIQKSDGSEAALKVTDNGAPYKFSLQWSPDSKKILFNDRLYRLQVVDIDSKKVTLIDKGKYGEIRQFNWSPDSRWVVYGKTEKNGFGVIYLYDLTSGNITAATDNWYSSNSPTFSSNGKYLFFASARDFNPTYSETEWNHAYTDMERIYLIILSKDTPSPFAPEDNEVVLNTVSTEKSDKKADYKAKASVSTLIDLDGLQQRIVGLPVKAGNYSNINAVDDKVYYNSSFEGVESSLKVFDLKKKEETDLGNYNYVISANDKKMLVSQKGGRYAVIDLPSSKIDMKETVDLSNMNVLVDYSKEWKQIFDESWRQMRDFFYVPNMHGVDWNAMHEKYEQLVPYVRHRNDLTYIIGEMIGELSIGHAYVNSGEKPEPKRIVTGLLGAKLSRDALGFYKIDEVLPGANWNKSLRSPLTEIGVNVKAGDFILAVNGQETSSVDDIYSLLVNTAGKQVELTVNAKPTMTGSRKVIVEPIASEADLYYYKWVQDNIRKVSEATNGEVGYIHIPDMGVEGLNEFVKYFYPQLDKKALIIDDRGNGGGNVSPMILERLQREAYRATMRRGQDEGRPVPQQTMLGPKVLLIDNYSASDGDLFPYGFKKLKLGTVIGKRSWGGVVGISGSLPFIDGGDLRKPEFASYSSDSSEWIIEGHGVDPDIEIDNDAYEEYMGTDAQLNKAIEVAKEQLVNYKPMPAVPTSPDKSK
jgi:tricorn protease